jgi:hypothetical protein
MRRRRLVISLASVTGLTVLAGALAVTAPASGAVSAPLARTAPAAVQPQAPAAPVARKAAPHPVPPKMQVLAPRGVDAAALGRLRADRTQTAAALAAPATDPATPAVVIAPTITKKFTLVGLTWSAHGAPQGIDIKVRVREAGAWSGWHSLGVEDAGPDPGTPEGRRAASTNGSSPLLTNGADGVQVVVHSATGRAPVGLKVDLIDAGTSPADGEAAATGPDPAAGPAALSASSASSATAAAVRALAGSPVTVSTASSSPVGTPPRLYTRAQWGADESIRLPVLFNQTVRAMVVHHTDTTNSYTTLAQAEAQIRAVYAFHVNGRHWSDIGYNFLVDRYGRIFEGRAGSITRAVMGAHTGGFNTYTMGVAALGTFVSSTPPSAMVTSIARVIAWKMGQYGANPNGRVRLTSAGGGTSRYPAGTTITANAVTGHRTYGHTACPGDALWARLVSIRSQATAIMRTQRKGTGSWPVTGRWTEGGAVQPGWFRAGTWTLRRPDGTAQSVHYGTAGDIPFVGDWDGDGVTGIGVKRGQTWYFSNNALGGANGTALTNNKFIYADTGDLPVIGVWPGQTGVGVGVVRSNKWYLRGPSTPGAIGPSVATFVYGLIGDLPVVGDWDGDGSTTPGVTRGGGTWYRLSSLTNLHSQTFKWGTFGDVPSGGDWDGNGATSPSVVRGSKWYDRNDALTSYTSRVYWPF